MIAVIADDFTGAAELAGLGLRYGLRVEIDSNGIENSDAELLIIATDTRSMTSEKAYNEVKRITEELIKSNVLWIYKKTDSVLRGHVLTELKAMLEATNKDKVLLVPSNPAYGRLIKNGTYYINNTPVHLTGFADDPEYSLLTSNVLEILGDINGLQAYLVTKKNDAIVNGVAIAEVSSINDLDYWAEKVNQDIIPAGASGFFSSLLKVKGFNQVHTANQKIKFGKKFLFICGSAFSQGRIAVEEAKMKGAKVCEMPDDVFYDRPPKEKHFKEWVKDTINAFKSNSKVIVEINQPVVKKPDFARRLRIEIAKLVEEVIDKVEVDELFIDGGATVYAISKQLNMSKFLPCQEIAPGVIRMKVDNRPNFHLTIKPGSYLWPDEIWKFD
ncbi:four-carbon acid sugar kinase family protein [Melioribacteraceae bacterium 4301-Me]|uniref:four-carbon acid sugar kinase family protein n=1 Tax=Pyranulibacter aquaticus TaxID=3163344 RepID=UPI00359BBB71